MCWVLHASRRNSRSSSHSRSRWESVRVGRASGAVLSKDVADGSAYGSADGSPMLSQPQANSRERIVNIRQSFFFIQWYPRFVLFISSTGKCRAVCCGGYWR